jgi:hypothetical protein
MITLIISRKVDKVNNLKPIEMKKLQILKGWAIPLMMVLAVSGCKKEETPPDDLQNLSFDAQEVIDLLPDGLKNSTNEYAQTCVSYVEAALDMSSFIDNMDVPDNATKSDFKGSKESWQWTWQYAGESFTFYWSYEESGGKRYWTMDIQLGNGPRYDYIDAWETEDGSQGELTFNYAWAVIYSGECTEDYDFLYWTYTWYREACGTYHLSFVWDSDNSQYTCYIKYEVVVNADGSGSVEYFLDDELFYGMEWDVHGNGSWFYYYDGEVVTSGTWVAGQA